MVFSLFITLLPRESFEEISVVPTDTQGRSYASIIFDGNEKLHLYIYNVNDEHNPDHLVSDDFGKTWTGAGVCHLAKGSRNIQTALIDGIFYVYSNGMFSNHSR